MTLTLLLDLDDTLLENDQSAFFAAFASTLTGHLSRLAPAEAISRGMHRGVQAMFLNDDPGVTLVEAFYRELQSELPSVDLSTIQAEVDRYYEEVYPSLASHTRVKPEAVSFVDWAVSQGFRIAIATNPVFTTSAVAQRLSWAGLPVDDCGFALLTSNETFHFAKSAAFYGEVLARLGWPDEPVLMAGDDLHLDIIAAQAAGLPAFHVVNGREETTAEAYPSGSLSELRGWLESTDPDQLRLQADPPEAILATLRSTPAGLAGLLAGIPLEEWTPCDATGEWGPTEILCHLRDVDQQVNLPRIQTILGANEPFIVAQDTDKWAEERSYHLQDGHEALRGFLENRRTLIGLLSRLKPDDWRRRARHSIFGPTDLRELAGISAEHDRSHVRQLVGALREAAGCCA
jgi:FMN phosphatase YigB (HAD superfamily)